MSKPTPIYTPQELINFLRSGATRDQIANYMQYGPPSPPKRIWRPRFTSVRVSTPTSSKTFSDPVRISNVAKYIGISIDEFLNHIDKAATSGDFTISIVTDATETPVHVTYIRKEPPA